MWLLAMIGVVYVLGFWALDYASVNGYFSKEFSRFLCFNSQQCKKQLGDGGPGALGTRL